MILFYKNGNTLKIHNPSTETKYYQMPSVNSVLATEGDLTKVTTVSSAIKQPAILTPANNSTGFNGDITFTGFETIETFTGTLDAISIAIATDINFTNVVVLQRIDTTDTNGFNIAVDLSSSDLYIKVKYHSDLYSSVWSNPVKTTTPEYIINKPTIIGPTNGATGVALFPMISGSDFTYVGVDETHESTTYQIAKDVTFTNIAYNVTSTTDLTSHLITEDLDYETTYYIRMRYNGSKYGNSEWSNTITISTLDIKNTIIDITSTSTGIRLHKIRTIDHKGINAIAYGWRTPTNYYAKIDNDNKIVKQYIENKFGNSAMYDAIVDGDGNIIFVGHGIVAATNTNALRILKISPDFVVLKEINLTGVLAKGLSIKKDSNGNYFICGTSHADTTGVLIKLNNNLDILVAKTIQGPTIGSYFALWSLEIDSSNNILVFGGSATTGMAGHIILKYDNNLTRINAKILNYYGNNTALYGQILDTVKDNSGNIYAVGRCGQWDNTGIATGMIFRINSNLNVSKIKDIPNSIFANTFSGISFYNGYLFVSTLDSYILKFDLELNLIKTIKFNRSNNINNAIVNDIFKHTLDNNGNLYGVGYIADVNGRVGSHIVILANDNDITTGSTSNGLYNIITNPLVVRDLSMTEVGINVTEGGLSGTNTVVGTTFTEVTNTIVHMDL